MSDFEYLVKGYVCSQGPDHVSCLGVRTKNAIFAKSGEKSIW